MSSLSQTYPPLVPSAQINVARQPLYGGEVKVHASPYASLELGVHTINSTNSGTTDLDAGYAVTLSADPRDLYIMLRKKGIVAASTSIVFTVVGTDQTSAALTGTATFDVPTWRNLPDKTFNPGFTVRVVPGTAGKKFKTITSIRSNAPADVLLSIFEFLVIGVPDASTFSQIGCTTGSSFNSIVRPARTIMCGMDGKFTKRGRAPVGELSISAKTLDHFSGIKRLEGVPSSTVILEPVKDNVLASEYLLFTGVVITSDSKMGEGEDEASQDGKAQFEQVGIIPAGDGS